MPLIVRFPLRNREERPRTPLARSRPLSPIGEPFEIIGRQVCGGFARASRIDPVLCSLPQVGRSLADGGPSKVARARERKRTERRKEEKEREREREHLLRKRAEVFDSRTISDKQRKRKIERRKRTKPEKEREREKEIAKKKKKKKLRILHAKKMRKFEARGTRKRDEFLVTSDGAEKNRRRERKAQKLRATERQVRKRRCRPALSRATSI
ncbi:hypothetical protein PUN28_004568 [Cardiocondyla obscurior]|uniref:Uncharacterized protein n=1 Tax=Cardiocondyla obscurior TaxID=286306 RepID=A0AAW2GD62_9HYME